MPPNWLPSSTEIACMIAGARTGFWVCWAYKNAVGDKVVVWNRDSTYPPLDHQYAPVGYVTIRMDEE